MGLKEEVAAGRSPYYKSDSPQTRRIRAAMDDMHKHGIQPNLRIIMDRIGGYYKHPKPGASGRAGIAFSIHMEELGYVQDHRGGRWRKPDVR